MSQTITLSFPLFQTEAKPSRIVAVRKPAAATAVATPTKKAQLFTDSFAENISTAAYCTFSLALVTWMTVFVAAIM